MKKVLVCDGDWTVADDGISRCSGTLTASTTEELVQGSGLTVEERAELHDYGIVLMVVVFGFLVMKKVVK